MKITIIRMIVIKIKTISITTLSKKKKKKKWDQEKVAIVLMDKILLHFHIKICILCWSFYFMYLI